MGGVDFSDFSAGAPLPKTFSVEWIDWGILALCWSRISTNSSFKPNFNATKLFLSLYIYLQQKLLLLSFPCFYVHVLGERRWATC